MDSKINSKLLDEVLNILLEPPHRIKIVGFSLVAVIMIFGVYYALCHKREPLEKYLDMKDLLHLEECNLYEETKIHINEEQQKKSLLSNDGYLMRQLLFKVRQFFKLETCPSEESPINII